MYKIIFLLLAFSFHQVTFQAQVVENILAQGSDLVQHVFTNQDKHEFQLIYSQITRDENGTPSIESFSYSINEENYFYPASTAKFPVALCALEKLNEINESSDMLLDGETPIAFGAIVQPQFSVYSDETAENNTLTINHLIKKVMVVSDNEANNLLYAFSGQKYVNDFLQRKKYHHAKITDRVGASGFSHEDNRSTNPFMFYRGDSIVYLEEGTTNDQVYSLQLDKCKKGKAYLSDGKLVQGPFNFCHKNFLSIPTLHDLLVSVVLPEATEPKKRLHITEEQRIDLLSFMSQRPRESKYPKYSEDFYDSYVKFFISGDTKDPMPDHLRIFNKVGFAHGYLTDLSYIVDLKAGIEFILVATVHVNDNETFNDDTYEYDSLGIPFLAEVGRLFYAHELQRNHTFDTSKLRTLTYD